MHRYAVILAWLLIAQAEAATLEWTPPSTRVDGSPLTNLAGYRIYSGCERSGQYERSPVAIDDPAVTSWTVDPPGACYFAVTALDSNGLESAYSNETILGVTEPPGAAGLSVRALESDMTVFRNDTFTEASETALESHTPDTGLAWQGEETVFSVGAGTGTVFREAQATGQAFAVGNDSLTETHYFAELKGIVLGGIANTDSIGIAVRSNQGNGGFFDATHYELEIQGSDGWRLSRVVPAYSKTFFDFDLNFNSANGVDGTTVIDLKLEVETIDVNTVRLTASINLDGAGYVVVSTSDDTDAGRITIAGDVAFKVRGNATASEFNAEDFVAGGQTIAVGQVTETALAQAVASAKQRAAGLVTETNLSQAIGSAKAAAVGLVSEVDLAQAIARAKSKATALVSETDATFTIAARKTRTVGLITESDFAQAVQAATAGVIGQVTEIDLARVVSAERDIALVRATESDAVFGLGRAKQVQIVGAAESDAPFQISAERVLTLLQASESDIVFALTVVKLRALGLVTEADLAQPITAAVAGIIAQVLETATSLALTIEKLKTLGLATEADVALALTVLGGDAAINPGITSQSVQRGIGSASVSRGLTIQSVQRGITKH